MSWAMSPVAASRAGIGRLPRGTEHDAKVGGRTGPKVGKAHVAEWRRVGAKRVLGDVGRGEGAGAEGERTAGIVVMVSVMVDRKGVGNDSDVKPRCRSNGTGDDARKGGGA